MPFAWKDYLGIARVHINETLDPGQEPCRAARDRCAMSRAYYAALNSAQIFVESTWDSPSIGNGAAIHKGIPRWLKSQPKPEIREIGELLVRLRKKRERADYDGAEFRRSFQEAYNSVRDSESVFRSISNCVQSP